METNMVGAIDDQRRLGINSLLKGHIVKAWGIMQAEWERTTHQQSTKNIWPKKFVSIIHTYTYGCWKARNEELHNKEEGVLQYHKKLKLQQKIKELYKKGRDNLTDKEKRYFKLPVEQRIKKGVVSMSLWVQIVEILFRKRGETTQEKIDQWLIKSTPERNWKDKYKGERDKLIQMVEELRIP